MLNGTYDVTANTPLGMKRGTLKLQQAGPSSLSADLRVRGLTCRIVSASCSGDSFELMGRISHLLGAVDFRCEGSVTGDVLVASGSSGSVSIGIKGRRVG